MDTLRAFWRYASTRSLDRFAAGGFAFGPVADPVIVWLFLGSCVWSAVAALL